MSAESQELTSLTLLEKLHGNNAVAWERFVKLYAPLVYTWARNAGVLAVDVTDIGQEVFQVVSQKLSGFERERKTSGAFRSWLWGITRIQIAEHLRQRCQQTNGEGGSDAQRRLQQHQRQADEPDRVQGKTPQQLLFQNAIEILRSESEPNTWQAFWRMGVDGVSARSAGEELGMTPRAVRQAKFRVTQKLRLLLNDESELLTNRLDFPEETS